MSALSPRDQIAAIALLIVLLAGLAVLTRRLAVGLRDQGYRMGPSVLVRCRDGHLFTTNWTPYAMVPTARRREDFRYQYCPVGRHWSLITQVPR